MIDPDKYLPFCTGPKQEEVVRSIAEHGSVSEALRHITSDPRQFRRYWANIQQRAAAGGYAPEAGIVQTMAQGEKLSKRSYLYNNQTGETHLTWYKTDLKAEAVANAWQEAAREFAASLPKIKIPSAPKSPCKDRIPWFNIGDAHIGMVAYAPEVGHNFDLKIAEAELCKALEIAISDSPNSERCVIQDMGDGTHAENFAGLTEASGHALDLDTRFPKMVHVYIRTMRYIIDRALSKYKFVDVIINQGNHSRTNDIWMKELLAAAYNTERLNVLDNTNVFIPYRMGNTFVMCHHSDKCKPNRLASVMATDYPQDWGESIYRYVDIGHIHHGMQLKEFPGVRIESFNQLAPRDKFAHDGGWRSRSLLTVVDRSKTYGEVARRTVPVERVKDILSQCAPGSEAKKRTEVYSV